MYTVYTGSGMDQVSVYSGFCPLIFVKKCRCNCMRVEYYKRIIPAAVIFIITVFIFTSCSPSRNRRQAGITYNGSGEDIVRTASQFLGVPYKNGGESPSGFDCSGYVMYVYGLHGIRLPRGAGDQYDYGRQVSLRNACPGDLLFFRTKGFGISHVAIYAGGGQFIHAPSSGKKISYASLENSYWNSRYAGAVTFLDRTSRPSGRREWVH